MSAMEKDAHFQIYVCSRKIKNKVAINQLIKVIRIAAKSVCANDADKMHSLRHSLLHCPFPVLHFYARRLISPFPCSSDSNHSFDFIANTLLPLPPPSTHHGSKSCDKRKNFITHFTIFSFIFFLFEAVSIK